MATPVSICSNALLKLGSRAISSFTDGSDTATLCANLYDDVVKSLLRAHLWNFAVKRAQLPAEVATPLYEYSYQHQIPSDCLRLLEVDLDTDDYQLENNRVLCDTTPINILYVAYVTDTAQYDSLFVELLTQKMTAELAYAVTRSDSKANSEMQKFAAMLKQARSIDAQECPNRQMIDFPLLAVRSGGSSWLR